MKGCRGFGVLGLKGHGLDDEVEAVEHHRAPKPSSGFSVEGFWLKVLGFMLGPPILQKGVRFCILGFRSMGLGGCGAGADVERIKTVKARFWPWLSGKSP